MKIKMKERRKFNYLMLILVVIVQIFIILHLINLKAKNEALIRLYQELMDKRVE